MADSDKLSFVELMKQQPSYGPLLNKPAKYQLTALYDGTHWSLAIKRDQPDLPYVTFEVISGDGCTVVRAVRKVDYEEDELRLLSPKHLGTYGPDKTLRDLCKLADEIFLKLGDNDKRQQFFTLFVRNLGYTIPRSAITSQYYIIEVKHGSYKKCFLGTQHMTMLFDPPVSFGNMSGMKFSWS